MTAQIDGADIQGITHHLRALQYLSTNTIQIFYGKQTAIAARAHRNTTYILLPESAQASGVKALRAYEVIVELSKHDGRSNEDLLSKMTAKLEAYLFPSLDRADVILEQDTVRLS